MVDIVALIDHPMGFKKDVTYTVGVELADTLVKLKRAKKVKAE